MASFESKPLRSGLAVAGSVAALAAGNTLNQPEVVFAQEGCVTTQDVESVTTICDDPSKNNDPAASTQASRETSSVHPARPSLTIAQRAARQLMHLEDEGRLTFRVLYKQDLKDHSTPLQNVESVLAGKKAHTTQMRDCKSGLVHSRHNTTGVDTRLLKFIVGMSEKTPVKVNSIAGQCHSVKDSKHFAGKAVDLACPMSPKKVKIANQVGRMYNIKHNFESCSRGGHYHYSVGGN